jgi:hypothetical protein
MYQYALLACIMFSIIDSRSVDIVNNNNIAEHFPKYDNDTQALINYLYIYGYLDTDENAYTDPMKMSSIEMNARIDKFKKFYELNNDNDLKQFINKKRCGVRDALAFTMNKSRTKWAQLTLRWAFYAPKRELIIAQRAFNAWSNLSGIKFEYNNKDPNIIISFQSYPYHTFVSKPQNCTFSSSGEIAHAYPPPSFYESVQNTEIHIKSGDPDIYRGNFLLNTLIHEIGHALGLAHHIERSSVMYPMSPSPDRLLTISKDDIISIQDLYGKPGIEIPDICKINPDNIFIFNNYIYIIYKNWFWNLDINPKHRTPTAAKNIKLLFNFIYTDITIDKLFIYHSNKSDAISVLYRNDIYTLDKNFELLYKNKYILWQYIPINQIRGIITDFFDKTYIFYSHIIEFYNIIPYIYDKQYITDKFVGISEFKYAFRYIDGDIYFIDKDSYAYKYNQFSNTMSKNSFDMTFFNICNDRTISIIRRLLNKLEDKIKE